MSPEKFLEIMSPEKSASAFRIGIIADDYTSGRPNIIFDGESSASTKTYPYLSSYTPTANDRVLLAIVGKGWIILGEII